MEVANETAAEGGGGAAAAAPGHAAEEKVEEKENEMDDYIVSDGRWCCVNLEPLATP